MERWVEGEDEVDGRGRDEELVVRHFGAERWQVNSRPTRGGSRAWGGRGACPGTAPSPTSDRTWPSAHTHEVEDGGCGGGEMTVAQMSAHVNKRGQQCAVVSKVIMLMKQGCDSTGCDSTEPRHSLPRVPRRHTRERMPKRTHTRAHTRRWSFAACQGTGLGARQLAAVRSGASDVRGACQDRRGASTHSTRRK
jgi:hypothetical protein